MAEWRAVGGYEGLYEVSDEGEVRSIYRGLNTGRVLKPSVRAYGRRYVALCKEGKVKNFSIARVVLAAFVGPANGRLALHNNDNPADDRLENLRYGTNQDNMTDKVLHGHSLKGHRHPKARLTEEEVRDVRKMLSCGLHPKDIAKQYGVSPETILGIKHRRNWAWLE